MNYRKVIDAALRIEGGVWGLAAALVDEVPTTEAGRVVRGEWPKVVKALKESGATSTDGEPYKQPWLQRLFEVESWVRKSRSSANFRQFPFRRVEAAKHKATGDYEQASLLLKAGGTMHMIAGTKAQPLAEALATASPEEIAEAIPKAKRREVGETLDQLHPATAKRAPLGLPDRKYGFILEMSGVSQRLLSDIDAYVDAWEKHAPTAKEEEKQIERDLLAPKILRLRMTVEEVEVP